MKLKSSNKPVLLFAKFAKDNMPSKLENVISSPEQLFEIIRKLDEKSLKVTEKDELVIILDVFGVNKEYPLPLESQFAGNV